MPEEAFAGYVEPGGLTDRFKIRLLVCYLLERLDLPVTAQTIADILLDRGLVNYFELSAAMGELISMGSMQALPTGQKPEQYVITQKGRRMLSAIEKDLPLAVREKAMASADELVLRRRVREQNKVVIAQVEDGYTISMQMLDIGSDLMRLSLFVPDREQAELIADRFYRNPQRVYKGVLELLTDAFK